MKNLGTWLKKEKDRIVATKVKTSSEFCFVSLFFIRGRNFSYIERDELVEKKGETNTLTAILFCTLI